MEGLNTAESNIVVSFHGKMVVIDLDRPLSMNSLTLGMIRAIRKVLKQVAESPDVRLVLFRGAGDQAFCAGGDIKTIAEEVKKNHLDKVEMFFREEYGLDLFTRMQHIQ
jgi:enoyl-CoA hydratase/carnithine racemase